MFLGDIEKDQPEKDQCHEMSSLVEQIDEKFLVFCSKPFKAISYKQAYLDWTGNKSCVW